MKKIAGKLAKVSGHGSKVDSQTLYDQWAGRYNTELINEYGYIAPFITVDKLKDFHLDKDIEIIDVGCGTGLVGLELHKLGYSNIDGYDISQKMLKAAKKTKIYKSLKQVDLNLDSFSPNKTYDLLICVGSFGYGALGPKAFINLLKLVKSRGLIMILMNSEPFISENYQKYILELEKQKLFSIKSIDDRNYMSKLERPGKLIIAIKS
jgi:predicted TPR repeat methyltransferase